MRILVVGAGAIGGYFGGRLLEAGRDVTFLVRPRRAAQLAKMGLVIRSRLGDVSLAAPPMVAAEEISEPFDLVLLSCKAYDLSAAMESFAPAVGPTTAILPMLNGMSHVTTLAARFGSDHVLGGLCMISVTLDPNGAVLHLNDLHSIVFGDLDGARPRQIVEIAAAMAGARFDSRISDAIRLEMWEKWVFIAAGAGITCLMRAAVGDVVAAGATDLAEALFDECASIAAEQGFPPREQFVDRMRERFREPGSLLTASMLRDIEQGAPVEGEHILGDLYRRSNTDTLTPSLLRVAYAHVKAYEARREREMAGRRARE